MESIDILEQINKAERLAENILIYSRNILMVNLRFMDAALTQLKLKSRDANGISTDGEILEYGLRYILLLFKEEREAVPRNFLHLVLHCVFRHMYIHTLVDQPRWDLACDIAVENIINELNLEDTRASRQAEQADIIEALKAELNGLTAEKLYRYYLDAHLSDSAIAAIRSHFYADDHSTWYLSKDDAEEGTEEGYSSEGGLSDGGGEASKRTDANTGDNSESKGSPQNDDSADGAGDGENNGSRDSGSAADSGGNDGTEGSHDGGGSSEEEGNQESEKGPNPDKSDDGRESGENEGQDQGSPEKDGENKDPDDTQGDDDGENEDDQGRDDQNTPIERNMQQSPDHNADDEALNEAAPMEKKWRDLSETIEQDLENFSKLQGTRAGSFLQNLRAVNREKVDYETFLKKFAVRTEVMKIDDEEFDYIFYTYGLKMFGRMPLIEPLEYREAKRIREFVIAIDTSGSVSGELVQAFIQKTYNILKSTESFSSRINLHIIQCDAEVQKDIKITDREELEQYLKTMQILGLGGTDFRPVFAHVDELIAQKEFTNLRGLLYFTDGYGAFPAKKPDYDTAFVFIDDNDNNPETPSWAIRVVLHKDEISP